MKTKLWFKWLGLLFAGLALGACSRLDPEPDQLPTGLPTLSLRTDTLGMARFRLDSLAKGRHVQVSFEAFAHGKIVTSADGLSLFYQATDTSHSWRADSARYTLCFDAGCRSGLMRIANSRYKADPDTTPTPAPCQPLPLTLLTVDEAGTQAFRLEFAAGDTGRVTAISHLFYTLRRDPNDSLRLEYIALGGPQDIYAGFDQIDYEGHAGGQPFCGSIEVTIGDLCQPRAHLDDLTLPDSGSLLINPTTLMVNDTGCGSTTASFNFRLDVRPYSGTFRQPTRFGIVKDTIVGGQPRILYRRTAGGTEADSFFYYLENQADEFVTRARVWLQ